MSALSPGSCALAPDLLLKLAHILRRRGGTDLCRSLHAVNAEGSYNSASKLLGCTYQHRSKRDVKALAKKLGIKLVESVGPGGVELTPLAIAIVAELRTRYPDW